VAGPNDGISFSLGLIHVALAIAGVAIGVRALSRTRRLDAIVFAAAALAGALLATTWTSIVWEHVATLQYLQFPWRTLCVPALFIPLLALYVFDRIGAKATIAVIVLIVLVNLTHTQPKSYLTYDDEYFYPETIVKTGYETTTRGEYEPRWVQMRLGDTGNGLMHPDPRMSVRTLSWTSTRHQYSITAPVATLVMDSTNYYPGWTVMIDGRETSVTPAPVFGLISFTIPTGQHMVAVALRQTPVRRSALMISLATLIALLIAMVAAYAGGFRGFWPGARCATPTSPLDDHRANAADCNYLIAIRAALLKDSIASIVARRKGGPGVSSPGRCS
jgi:hypothetical protein